MAFSFSSSSLSSVAPVCSNALIKSSSHTKIMEKNMMHHFDRATEKEHLGILGAETALGAH